ncbi:MAG: tetratricopeptide repeat protein [Desulfobacterales bacterium]|nr:tetratricopeptide repeat protein [Desulfobacterales bacterium]
MQSAYLEYFLGYEAEIRGEVGGGPGTLRPRCSKSIRRQLMQKRRSAGCTSNWAVISDAVAGLEKVLQETSDHIPALMLLAELYGSQKKLDEAIPLYEKVIAKDPERIDARLHLGRDVRDERGEREGPGGLRRRARKGARKYHGPVLPRFDGARGQEISEG